MARFWVLCLSNVQKTSVCLHKSPLSIKSTHLVVYGSKKKKKKTGEEEEE